MGTNYYSLRLRKVNELAQVYTDRELQIPHSLPPELGLEI